MLWLPVSAATLLVLCTGCVRDPKISPIEGPITGMSPAAADARAAIVQRDPIAYLHTVAERCRNLQQYTVKLVRYERRGALIRTLQGPEHIQCSFRSTPFSIHMQWLDDNVKYNESTYVSGQHGDKIRFLSRGFVLGLKAPPGINEIDAQTPVSLGETLQPITDFGVARMLERTLRSMAEEDAVVTYVGLKSMQGSHRPVHHLRMTYSAKRHPAPIQDLYVDVQTDLPAGTELRLPNGDLNAAYLYEDLNPQVRLTDADFLLSVERPKAP
jgi:hypothetical protein